uniref:U-scoloptoxin(14)-Sa1a n=1 Tax=Scolopendra alternans TaxID=1329349 RepID=TXE1A_SCOAL|nr:RecName: Full=U-scoloptoxin(14)-Sa1a; Short=U-SLPTX(14)-Sa1a; Flags: Precursor [Scolopendra alternans]
MNRILGMIFLFCLISCYAVDIIQSAKSNGCSVELVKRCQERKCASPCCRDGECHCGCK